MTEKDKITIATNLWFIEWACMEKKFECADIYETIKIIRDILITE